MDDNAKPAAPADAWLPWMALSTCERFQVGVGGTLCLPRGVEHELWNDTEETVQMVDIYTPSGIEALFAGGGRRGT